MRLSEVSFQVCLILLILVFAELYTQAARSSDGSEQSVKIGLLIADKKSVAAIHGAELAIMRANDEGGFNGHPFQLVVRSTEGPWGTGSREAVNLIFEDKVWALLGSHGGRDAHLVEQVATKATVVFVSAWASDPTLSQAFVPWFFNCVPNDLQQADALIDEIFERRKLNKVAVVSGNDYDSKQALNTFLKEIKLKEKTDPVQFVYENFRQDLNGLLDQINVADAECIILFCRTSASLKIIRQIRQRKMDQPVFGSLFLLNENELSDHELQNLDDIQLVSSEKWSDPRSLSFSKEYNEIFGKHPGMVAAYAFDGMNLIIESIKRAGSSEREKIQKELSGINYEGITGPIEFDDKGNRSGSYHLVRTKNGFPVLF